MEPGDQSLLRVLNSKAPGTVAIFDKGDFFSCYREDAVMLATEVFMSDVCLKIFSIGDTTIQYLTLNTGQYQRVVRELLMLLRYRVELYELVDEKWNVKAKGTVGNMGDFGDIIDDVIGNGNTIMAVRITDNEDNRTSVSFWNVTDFRVMTSEFNDNNLFAQLEQCMIALSPRECVIYSDSISSSSGSDRLKKLSLLLKRVDVLETKLKDKVNISNWEQVKKVFTSETYVENLSDGIKVCLCGLFSYLKLGEQEECTNKFTLSDYRTSGYMHINAGAVRALELFSLSYYQDVSNIDGTLYGLLNKCKTMPGQRMLRDWLARPLCDYRQIIERQDAIEALLKNPEVRETLSDALLTKIPDINQLSRKLLLNKAKLQDCYRIYQMAVLLRQFERSLRDLFENDQKNAPAIKDLMLEPVYYGVLQFDKFCQLIRSTVDVEFYEKTGDFRVKPEIDPELLSIANNMKHLEKKAERARDELSSRLALDSIKLDSNAQHGFFYRVTLKVKILIMIWEFFLFYTNNILALKFMLLKYLIITESDRFIVLTGANMGGKSTYLRSAALCTLLAQIVIIVLYAILFFMKTATSNSLVIIDELGRGTSTYDGFGLAWAIACDLLERTRCFCLFATHFHEMGAMAEKEGAVAMQMSVSVDEGKITMLYEVRPGVAQSSFGIDIARMVGFSEEIIQEASSTLKDLEKAVLFDSDHFIDKLKAANDAELSEMLIDL
uniref:DNA_MISMATCH_REPAIR_2 domain-containing protein n=1 Tax=Heterorhabditis bacteriophora TaxID=37862 RepID=A0A1I7XR64_HETBA